MSSLRDELVEQLERENDELRARVCQLEELAGIRLEVPLELGLTRMEAALFGVLLKREIVSKATALQLLYLHKQDEAEEKIIDVYVCKMRPKLKPFGIPIETVWGQGYRIPPPCQSSGGRDA